MAAPGSAHTVVMAPDSFKGSVAAGNAARALATGWARARPHDTVVLKPMADGGEGTQATVAAALPGAIFVPVEVRGPHGESVQSSWLQLPDGTALVELAATSGLPLFPQDAATGEYLLAPGSASSFGTGQAIRAALDAGASRVAIALGGSASSDGGSGLLAALGVQFLDPAGEEVPLGVRGLEHLARINAEHLVALPAHGLIGWTDVRSPLLGRAGAVAVFGPQKGLTGADAVAAENALARYAAMLGGDSAAPGTGAAGGTGFGLASIGASLNSGAAAVAETIGLENALRAADFVVTGEGSYDEQSAHGKVVSHVLSLATTTQTTPLLAAGRISAGTSDFAAAAELLVLAGTQHDPFVDAVALLSAAGEQLARGVSAAGS